MKETKTVGASLIDGSLILIDLHVDYEAPLRPRDTTDPEYPHVVASQDDTEGHTFLSWRR